MARFAHVWSLMVLALVVAMPSTPAQPPPSGDWTISSHVVVERQEVVAHGNVIIVRGGTLELRSATLRLEALPPTEPRIQVQSGGRLLLNGSEGAPSKILDGGSDVDDGPMWYNTDFHYRIRVESGGRLDAHDCLIEDVGSNQNVDAAPVGEGYRGSFVIAGAAAIDRCTLSFGRGTFDVRGGQADVNRTTAKDRHGSDVSFLAEQGVLRVRDLDGQGCFDASDGGVVVAESVNRLTCKEDSLFGGSGDGRMYMQNSTGDYLAFGSAHGFVRNSTISVRHDERGKAQTIGEAYLEWRVVDRRGAPVAGVEATFSRGTSTSGALTDADGRGSAWIEVWRLSAPPPTRAAREGHMRFSYDSHRYDTPLDVFEGATIMGLRLDDDGFREEYRLRFYKGTDSSGLGLVVVLAALLLALRGRRES